MERREEQAEPGGAEPGLARLRDAAEEIPRQGGRAVSDRLQIIIERGILEPGKIGERVDPRNNEQANMPGEALADKALQRAHRWREPGGAKVESEVNQQWRDQARDSLPAGQIVHDQPR